MTNFVTPSSGAKESSQGLFSLEAPFGLERLVPSNWQEGEAPSEPGLSRPAWLRPWRSFALPQFPPERGQALKNLITWF